MNSPAHSSMPARLVPFHSSDDSDRVAPAIGCGTAAVVFLDTGADLATLAGVLAARCAQMASLVSLIASGGCDGTMGGATVAAILEPSAELLAQLSAVVSNRTVEMRRSVAGEGGGRHESR